MKAIGSYVVLREVPLGKAAFSRTASGAVGKPIYPALTLWAMDRVTGMPVLLHPVTATTTPPQLPEHPNLLPCHDRLEQGGYHFLITELPPQATPANDVTTAAIGALELFNVLHQKGFVHGNIHPAHLWDVGGKVMLAGAGLHWNDHALSPARDLHELVLTLEQMGDVPTPLLPILYGESKQFSAQQLLTLLRSDQVFSSTTQSKTSKPNKAKQQTETTESAKTPATPPPISLEDSPDEIHRIETLKSVTPDSSEASITSRKQTEQDAQQATQQTTKQVNAEQQHTRDDQKLERAAQAKRITEQVKQAIRMAAQAESQQDEHQHQTEQDATPKASTASEPLDVRRIPLTPPSDKSDQFAQANQTDHDAHSLEHALERALDQVDEPQPRTENATPAWAKSANLETDLESASLSVLGEFDEVPTTPTKPTPAKPTPPATTRTRAQTDIAAPKTATPVSKQQLSGGRPTQTSEHNPISLHHAGTGLGQGLFLQQLVLQELLGHKNARQRATTATNRTTETPATNPTPTQATPATQTPQAPSKPNPSLPKLVDWDEVDAWEEADTSTDTRPLQHQPFATLANPAEPDVTPSNARTVFAVKIQSPTESAKSVPSNQPTNQQSQQHQTQQHQTKQLVPSQKDLPILSYEEYMPKDSAVFVDASNHVNNPAVHENATDSHTTDLNITAPNTTEATKSSQPSKSGIVTGQAPKNKKQKLKAENVGLFRRLLRLWQRQKVTPQTPPLPTRHDESFAPRIPESHLGRHAVPPSQPPTQLPTATTAPPSTYTQTPTYTQTTETSSHALQRLRSDVTRLRDQAAAKRDKLAHDLEHFDSETQIDLSFTKEDFERWAAQKGTEADAWQTPQQRREQERQIVHDAQKIERELVHKVIEAKENAIHFNWPQVERIPADLRTPERKTSKRLDTHPDPDTFDTLTDNTGVTSMTDMTGVIGADESQENQGDLHSHQTDQTGQQTTETTEGSEEPAPTSGVYVEQQPVTSTSAASAANHWGHPNEQNEHQYGDGTPTQAATHDEYLHTYGRHGHDQYRQHQQYRHLDLAPDSSTSSTSSEHFEPHTTPKHAPWAAAAYHPNAKQALSSQRQTPAWVWPTLGFLLLASANGWAWYYFSQSNQSESQSKSQNQESAQQENTQSDSTNQSSSSVSPVHLVNTDIPDAPASPDQTNPNASANPLGETQKAENEGFVNPDECCTVPFRLPEGAPSELSFTLTLLKAPQGIDLPAGYLLGSAPGTVKFPKTGEYELKASADGYDEQTLTVLAPNSGTTVVVSKSNH